MAASSKGFPRSSQQSSVIESSRRGRNLNLVLGQPCRVETAALTGDQVSSPAEVSIRLSSVQSRPFDSREGIGSKWNSACLGWSSCHCVFLSGPARPSVKMARIEVCLTQHNTNQFWDIESPAGASPRNSSEEKADTSPVIWSSVRL